MRLVVAELHAAGGRQATEVCVTVRQKMGVLY